MSNVLIFDLGTTYFKAVLFRRFTEPIATVRSPTPFIRSGDGRVEMPAEVFRTVLIDLAAELRRQQPSEYAQTAFISFASQANSFLLLDAEDQPITPLIAWTDRRAAEDEGDWIKSFNALPKRYAHTGIPVIGPNHASAKIRWLGQHAPDVWRDARKFCLVSDELTRWLSGTHVTEVGIAALTGLLDIHRCAWWQPALDSLRLDPAILPTLVRAGTDVGTLTPLAAAELELPDVVRVIVGCLDQYAGAIAAGNVASEIVSETTGTVLAVVNASDRFDPSLEKCGVYQGPSAVPGLYYRMVFSSISANLLEAYQREHASELTFDQLGALAEQSPPPFMTKLDVAASEAAGRPIFITPPATHGEATRCIMQAVADRLKAHLNTLTDRDRGATPTGVTCLGGAGQSNIWRQLKEDTIGLPMHKASTEEPTCLGAALCVRESFTTT